MKKTAHFLVLIGSALLTFSCEALLEERPKYTLNEQTLFRDQATAQLALNACFGYLAAHGVYGQSLINVAETGAGIGRENKNGDNLNSLGTAMTADGGGGEILRLWDGLYKTITECNIFIQAAGNSKLENKANMIAQAKFIRALCYYNLGFMFGGVPLKLGPPTPATTDMARSSQQQVLDQVIADLLAATADLQPLTSDAAIPSATAAYALLAKVYFLMASGQDAPAAYWKTAQSYGWKVIEALGELPLAANFGSLFAEHTRNSPEAIFLLNYSAQGVNLSWNKNSWMYSPRNSTLNGINFGNRSASRAFYTFFTERHPGDPRIDASFFHNSFQLVKGTPGTIAIYPRVKTFVIDGYPLFKKHFDSRQQGQVSGKSLIVYRYADLLLLLADAENELGNTPLAVKYVNRVLARARQSTSPAATQPADVPAGITQAELRQFIFDERLFELNQEGHSFIETRRRGPAFLSQLTRRHNRQADAIAGFDSAGPFTEYRLPEAGAALRKAMLMPIPTQEINTNKGIGQEDQNPGY